MAGSPPKKNSAFTFEVSLVSQADTDIFQTSVTLAAGDVQVSKDGGGFANTGTLPVEIASTGALTVVLSSDEMNADRIVVRFHDAAGDEWQDALAVIHTSTRQVDDVLYATETLTESYASDGDEPTLTQAIYAIQQFLQERDVLGATLTVKKLDGSTGAMTFTLDDAGVPTSITRAS